MPTIFIYISIFSFIKAAIYRFMLTAVDFVIVKKKHGHEKFLRKF